MKINHFLKISLSFTFLVSVMLPPPLLANPSIQKKQDIKKLLRVSGILEQLSYMKDSLTRSFASVVRFNYPEAPEAFWGEFANIVGEHEMEDLVARVVPVYDRHMDHEAVKKLIAMFENPFWAEWKKKMPIISHEAGSVGSKWSHETMQSDEIQEKLNALLKKHKLDPSKLSGKTK